MAMVEDKGEGSVFISEHHGEKGHGHHRGGRGREVIQSMLADIRRDDAESQSEIKDAIKLSELRDAHEFKHVQKELCDLGKIVHENRTEALKSEMNIRKEFCDKFHDIEKELCDFRRDQQAEFAKIREQATAIQMQDLRDRLTESSSTNQLNIILNALGTTTPLAKKV